MKNNDLVTTLKLNHTLIFFAILSSLCLIFSIGYEYFSQQDPCTLCKLQRLPYLGIFVMSCAGILMQNKKISLTWILAFSLVSLGLASYHVMVQKGLFSDPCKVGKVSSLEAFQAALEKKKGCSQVQGSLFNIPLSWLNVLVSFLCVVVQLIGFRTRKMCSIN